MNQRTRGAAASVAVVIPAYNRGDVVLRAVASVLAQTFADLEIVVVDDGSTDGTAAAVAGVADARLRVIVSPSRGGANRARNLGVRETTAPVIAFLDSDDEFLPGKLAFVANAFEAEPDLGTLVDSYAIVNVGGDAGEPEPLVNPVLRTSEQFLAALFDSTGKAERVRKSTSGISVRRDVAVAAGLFDENLRRVQDMEFRARLAKAARCRTTDRILWIKHELPDRISFDGPGFVESSLTILRRLPEYGARATGFAADVVAYLWMTGRRSQARRLAEDVALLADEFGAAGLARLLAGGVGARLVRPKVERLQAALRAATRASGTGGRSS